LVAGEEDGFVNVIGRAAAREVIYRSTKSLKHWTNSSSASKTLNEFVSNISHFEVRED
jgi:hypothetical protein